MENRKNLKDLIWSSKPLIVCLQETKVELIPEPELKEIWYNNKVGSKFLAAMGSSGGLATLWNLEELTCLGVLKWRYFICCKFKWNSTGEELIICNIYGPQTLEGKGNLIQDCQSIIR